MRIGKMKRTVAACLAFLLLVSAASALSLAFGAEDGRLAITHINEKNIYEGAGIIIDGAKYERIGDLGGFQWWVVLVFDWDAGDKCYKLIERNSKTGGSEDKSSMEIPRTGFAYGLCVGNDYTSSGGINYKQSDRMIKSYDYARTVSIGEKAYLYGVNLAQGQIKNNGKQWYLVDYVTESYIKMGEPESGKTAYEPGEEAKPMQYVIRPNQINNNHYAVGDCIFFDGNNKMPNGTEVKLNYAWWSCLVFCWDADQCCFVCVANDKTVGNGMEKTPPIPEGGFVILDCSSDSAAAVTACLAGTKAWLYPNGSNYTVYLNEKAETGTPVSRKTGSLASPAVNGVSDKGVLQLTEGKNTVSWNAVPGATEYLISVSTSSIHTFGEPILHPTRVSGTSYSFDSGKFLPGQKYTLFVQALASGKSSLTEVRRISCVYESALTSSLRTKTVVAFGDSLTARTGWVDMLSGVIGTDVVNSGVGGDTTNNGKARFKKDVLDKNADVVLICFGMNDQAQVISGKRPNVSLETYVANMEYFVDQIQKQGGDAVLICPHDAYNGAGYYSPGAYGLDYSFGYMKDFCEAVRQVAVKYGTDIIDIYTESKSEDMKKFLNAGDGIHQSTYGHEKWAEYVGNYLLAKYDGKDAASIGVACKDSSGKVLKEYGFTAFSGANIQIPAAQIEGYELTGDEKTLKAGNAGSVVYSYTASSGFALGDVNHDGKVNAVDYGMIKRYILKAFSPDKEIIGRMDINGDGSVRANDYMRLKRMVLRNI